MGAIVGTSWHPGWQTRAVTKLSKASLHLPHVPSLCYRGHLCLFQGAIQQPPNKGGGRPEAERLFHLTLKQSVS